MGQFTFWVPSPSLPFWKHQACSLETEVSSAMVTPVAPSTGGCFDDRVTQVGRVSLFLSCSLSQKFHPGLKEVFEPGGSP